MTISRPDRRWLFAHPAHFLAFGFGTGLSPKAPGTIGTLAALPIYLLLMQIPSSFYWPLVGLALLAGIGICGVASRSLGVHDHGGIVWDEIVAFLIVLPFAPQTLAGWVVAFTLFRLFDIWKPFPIRTLDRRIHGGLGIMLDDVVAAFYAVCVLGLISLWM